MPRSRVLLRHAVTVGNIVADLLSDLSPEYCRRLVPLLSGAANLNEITRAGLMRAMADEGAALQALTALKRIRETDASLSCSSVAIALETALAVAARNADDLQIDVVWTGPSVPGTSARRSAATLLGLIRSANHELLVVSFASFQIPDAMVAFREAAARGVSLHFVLESPEESSGRFRGNDDVSEFRQIPNARAYVWPKELRPPGGLLHAKAVVADRNRALVTSANLTANAIDVNIELGLFVQSEVVAGRIADHIFGLVDGGVLVALPS